MDKDLPHHDHNNTTYSPPAPPPTKKLVPAGAAAAGGGGGVGDRLKRDEWSEGAVSSLLEAYEAKWILRNRAKLKGQDWEDVAKHVSSRANSGKSPKTQTQCKNKIESMKKRYRSESIAVDGSSWPLYPRLDHLLRGSAPVPAPAPILPLRLQPQLVVELPSPPPPATTIALDLHGSNGIDKATTTKEDGVVVGTNYESSDKNPVDTDSSTPALYSNGDKGGETKIRIETERRRNHRRRKSSEEEEEGEDDKGAAGGGTGGRRNGKRKWEVAKSIRWLAEAVVRAEESRTEAMREVERMRSEAETKRAEMELKRTEIIANTQLEIARIFAGAGKGNIDSSSLRMGRN
ncbi:trihelix transcription factor ASIL2 [Impatiens glandulifera]|uniref:trihelix transcription factor ASIL2 n=1 Tax=Impatiens glandulifera TaxID=253017 RepID=UPI001FB0CA57|nr:trihelix transcription factor ASIL2 [Impatiens glandulifera]